MLERFDRRVPAYWSCACAWRCARRPRTKRPCLPRWSRSTRTAHFRKASNRRNSRLFMVPLEAAGISSGAACASAPSTTSVTRCDISTLPAAMAAGASAFTTVPSGACTRIGRRMPAVNGTSSLNQAAEHVHHRRQRHRIVGVHGTLHLRRPIRKNRRARNRRRIVDRDPDPHRAPASCRRCPDNPRSGRRRPGELADGRPHHALTIVLKRAHVARPRAGRHTLSPAQADGSTPRASDASCAMSRLRAPPACAHSPAADRASARSIFPARWMRMEECGCPSWKISLARGMEPGLMPPTSA